MSSGRRKKRKKSFDTKPGNKEVIFTIEDVFSMMDETSQLISQENSTRLSAMGQLHVKAEHYQTTYSKTPSDGRTGKNCAQQTIKMAF